MKRKKFALIMASFLLVATSCSNQTQNINSKEEQSQVVPSASTKATTSTADFINDTIGNNKLLSIASIDEDIIMIYIQTTDEKEKYIFINSKEKEIVTTLDSDTGLKGSLEFQRCSEGIVLYDQSKDVVILDTDFKVKEQFLVSDEISDTSGRNYSVLVKKEKLIFFQEDIVGDDVECTLYQCDYSGKNIEKLTALEGPEKSVGYLNTFNTICVSYDGDAVFFTGSYFASLSDGASDYGCFGRYDLKKSEFYVQQEGKEDYICTSTGILVFDLEKEMAKECSGTVDIIENDGATRTIQLKEKAESQNIYVSDYEKTVYTKYDADSNGDTIEDTSYISCYDYSTGEFIQSYEVDKCIDDIIIMDDGNEVFYTYYDDSLKIEQLS